MSYGVKTIAGAAKNFDDYISILQSQLTSLGLEPEQEIATEGNCFKVKGGFGCKARVYYKSVGKDIIVTPEVTRSTVFIVIEPILLCLGVCPGIVAWMWSSRNLSKTIAKVSNGIESSMAAYKASFRESREKLGKGK